MCIRDRSSGENIAALQGAARCYESQGQLTRAADCWRQVVSCESTISNMTSLARVLTSAGCHWKALAAWDQLLQDQPDLMLATRGRAQALHATGRHQEALETWDGVLAQSPEDDAARSGRALSLIQLGRPEEALSMWEQVSEALLVESDRHGIERARALLDLHLQDAEQRRLVCLLYTSPSPRDLSTSRMPSSA